MLRVFSRALSLYWRVLIVSLLLSAIILLGLPSGEPSNYTFLKLKPSVLFGATSLIWFLSLVATKNGLVHLLWGRRLQLSLHFWRRFTASLAAWFMVLALLNLLAAYSLPIATWLVFKTHVPWASVFLVTLALAAWLPASSAPGHAASGEA